MKKITTESIILDAARNWLRLKGWYVIRIQQGMGCHPGVSDLIAIKGGITVYIETKSPKWKGKLSRDQEKFRIEIEDHGGTFMVVDSIDKLMEVIK